MSAHPAFAHCQARVQARYAALPGDAEWQRLAGARTFSVFIEEARVGPFQPWVKGFSAVSREHDLDRGLRNVAADLVEEVSGWVPGHWQAAVLWFAWLPFLPVFEHLSRGAPPPDWMALDYRLGTLLDENGALRADALEQQGLSPLLAPGKPQQVAPRWAETWRQRWPATDRMSRRRLDAFCAALDAHLDAFRRAAPQSAWELREALRERLRLRFHQRLLEPVAVFIYLTLVLLDLERLRAELLRRCLFPHNLPAEAAA